MLRITSLSVFLGLHENTFREHKGTLGGGGDSCNMQGIKDDAGGS